MASLVRSSPRGLLVEATRSAELLSTRAAAHPLQYIHWTPPQFRHLNRRARRKLLRAGNQIGKTTVGLAEVVWWATGEHPYQPVREPPVEIWIVCTTWPQSVGIMKKFWALCPKNLLMPGQTCGARYGFGKDNPAVVFRNGSVVRFKTTNQGADALAGWTIHYVLIDEPTDEDIYRELDRRLTRTGGVLSMTLTPINRPVDYLRQLVRDGVVVEEHARLTVQNLTPIGAELPLRDLEGTLMDEAWIGEQRRLVLPRFAPVVLDGEWEQRIEGSVFAAFDQNVHVVSKVPDLPYRIGAGFDYGEGDLRTGGGIVGTDRSLEHPRVAVLSSWLSDGMTTPEDDALATLEAIEDAGALFGEAWSWRQVDHATGDKPTTGRFGRKSNTDLTAALERELRKRGELARRQQLDPAIRQAKTGRGGGAGSVWRGVEWLHRAMLRPGHFFVHEANVEIIDALLRWDGSEEHKDSIDLLRYATWPYAIRGLRGSGTVPTIYTP